MLYRDLCNAVDERHCILGSVLFFRVKNIGVFYFLAI